MLAMPGPSTPSSTSVAIPVVLIDMVIPEHVDPRADTGTGQRGRQVRGKEQGKRTVSVNMLHNTASAPGLDRGSNNTNC